MHRYFADDDDVAEVSTGDALEEWLAEPVVATKADPITYWLGMLAASHPLAQMALDFLSIPGTCPCLVYLFTILMNLCYV